MIGKKNITGIILAGGKSSRMKTDKGFIPLNNLLFIEHIINAVRPLVNNIIIVSNNSNYDEFGYKRINDLIKNAGPLAGIYTGLQYSKTDYNLVLSCDIPLINSSALELLLHSEYSDFDVIQLKSQNKTMPLIALYKKENASAFKALLNKGEKRLQFAVNQLKTKTIQVKPELETCLQNINTMEQLNELRHAVEH